MITMTFSKFANPDNFPDDDDIELYVLRNSKKILYIGISESNVWNRWFGNRGRMYKNAGGHWNGSDTTSISIIQNMPASLRWNIDLWTLKDCLSFLGIKYISKNDFPNDWCFYPNGFGRYTIKDVEPKFIANLMPEYNGTYNHGTRLTKRAADGGWASRYFEFISAGSNPPAKVTAKSPRR